ncbi:hypothetical protein [Rhizobium binxianense]
MGFPMAGNLAAGLQGRRP